MEVRNVVPNQSHNHHIFSQMIEMLIASGLGEKDYGFDVSKNRDAKLRYEDIAVVMNEEGFTTGKGKPITSRTLKVLVHRVRNQEQGSSWWEQQKPNWEWFYSTQDQTNKTRRTRPDLVILAWYAVLT